MISRSKALQIVKGIPKDKGIDYTRIDDENDIRFKTSQELSLPIPYGKYKGERIDLYMVTYGEMWGLEERIMGIDIKGDTGEPLYIIAPHGFIEI